MKSVAITKKYIQVYQSEQLLSAISAYDGFQNNFTYIVLKGRLLRSAKKPADENAAAALLINSLPE